MTIVAFDELEDRRGQLVLNGTKIVRNFTRNFQARSDNITDNEDTVSQHSNCPQFLSSHPVCWYSFLTDLQIQRKQNGQDGRVWIVTANYTSDHPPLPSATTNPMDIPPRIEFDGIRRKRVVWADRNGKPGLNTAKKLLDPPLEGDTIGGTVTIERNEPYWNWGKYITWMNKTNAYPIWGAPAGTLKVEDIKAKQSWWEGESYWVITYRIEYRPDGWLEERLSAGTDQLTGAGKWERIKDNKGEDVSEPVPLDEDGLKIPEADLPGASHYIEFDLTAGEADFTLLNIAL